MSTDVRVRVDGVDVVVPAGCSVAAALRLTGHTATRRALDGSGRSACCGMGVCSNAACASTAWNAWAA